ncbi:hypothetical protein SAMN05421863_11067 [Nitrosomonas communis]|uniref:Uncharacterized protein n=1 Tax=Nitrosomonas communis TaxID=44574 RepID=A0A1I4WFC1_9PROT|nr:hypothetical protein SAMN05421863_11067 [Nitrosomonas communis]
MRWGAAGVRVALTVIATHHSVTPYNRRTACMREMLSLVTRLRNCLESPILCQAPQHNAGHGDINPGFIRPGEALIAFTQSA